MRVVAVSEQETAQSMDMSLAEALASSLGISLMIYDRNDNLLFASRDFVRFFEVPPQVLEPGARLRDLLGAIYDLGARTGRLFSCRSGHISRDDWVAERIALHWRERYEGVEQLGDGRWVKLVKRRLPGGILITGISDVTDQKKRDRDLAEIRDQAALAQHILDNLANPVIVKDSDLRCVIVNDAFCRLLGFHPKNVVGRRASELVGEEAAAVFEDSERTVLETGVPIEFVEDIVRPDGKIVRSITRKRRSGTPGHYYVTVSIDHITTYSASHQPEGIARAADMKAARAPLTPKPRSRILVVDEDRVRAAARVARLRGENADAMAVHDTRTVFAFLETARSMGLEVDRVEASASMAAGLRKHASAGRFPALSALLASTAEKAWAAPAETDAAARTTMEESGGQAGRVSEEQPDRRPAGGPAAAPSQGEIQAMAAAGEGGAVAAPAAGRGETDCRRRVRILVAEDNDVNQIVFEQILEGLGVDYSIVSDGERAVAAWRETSPDLILMDVSMPVMSGVQACQAIRQAEMAAGADILRVPIIAVTAHAMSGDRDKCFAAGMDDYMTKPVSPEKLEAAIRNWISDKNLFFAAA